MMKPQTMMQVLQRLAWLCFFPVALVLIVVAGLLMYGTHRQQVAFVQSQLNTVAAETDAHLARHVQGLKALAAAAAVPSQAKPLAALHADAVSYEQGIGLPVVLADAQRRILLSSARPLGQPLPMLPVAEGPSALDRALLTGQPQVTDVVQGTVSKGAVIAVVVPVSGEPATQAWITSLSTHHLQRHLNNEPIAPGWNVVLMDGNGKSIAASGPDVDTSALPTQGAVTFTAPIQHARWSAVAHASPWTFYQPQIRIGAGLIALLGIAGFGSMWLVQRRSQQLNAAVSQLTDSSPELVGPTRIDDTLVRITEIEEVHRELRRLRIAEHMAEDRERQRLARELHDGLQQQIASVKIMVNLAARRSDQSPEGAELLQRVSDITQQVIDELHQIVNDLRPTLLDELGLVEAVQQLSNSTARATGLLIEVESAGDPTVLASMPSSLMSCAFRVIQESLNNVRKHAQATFVHVLIDVSKGCEHLSVRVSDDGIGFENASTDQSITSFGLISMRQRVTALGGTLSVSRGHPDDPTCGTTVVATMPMQSQSA